MTFAPIAARAAAKINLFLHVGMARSDGRHALSSLVAFAGQEAADTLEVRPAIRDVLNVTGRFAGASGLPGDNLVAVAQTRLRAQVRVREELDTPLEWTLHKAIPVAAGMGGGSADAAAALRLMVMEIFDLPHRAMSDIAPQLGGDVLACVLGQPAMMRGDGDQIILLETPGTRALLDRENGGGLPAILVNPGVSCPTGPVFDRYGGPQSMRDFGGDTPPDFTRLRDLLDWLAAETRNDLQAPAIELVPEIGGVLNRLEALTGAHLVRMTGSGATCFALFRHMDDALLAQARLLREHPEWWTRATLLGEGL